VFGDYILLESNFLYQSSRRYSPFCICDRITKFCGDYLDMTQALDDQWDEVNKQLDDLHFCRTVDGDPVQREEQLLGELDRLEYEAGLAYFGESPTPPNGKK
jgi:hypothetical protein